MVGAGIAGLAVAFGLERLGYTVRVLERGDSLPSEGAGITLWPNATQALEQLGLGDVVGACTLRLEEVVTLAPDGALLTRVPLERIEARFGPLVTAHRAELLAGLAEHVTAPVEFDSGVAFANGLRCRGERLEADLIVGADGIHSAVRELLAPGLAPRDVGYGVWRGIAETGAGTVPRAAEVIGSGQRYGRVALPDGRTYWFAALDGSDGSEDVDACFAGWEPSFPALLAATPAANRSFLRLRELPSLPRWQRGSAVLVGDAAHAMTPNLGQGAAQALIDVAVLVEELASHPLAEALQRYQRRRKRPAERVARHSRLVGRVAQASNPLGVRIRDAMARRTPPALAAWQLVQVLR